jgi:predicted ATPase
MITELHVSGYKSLHDVRLDCGGLNVLSGANAVGKSSLIQSLLLLRQSESNERISNLQLTGDLFRAGMAAEVVRIDAEELQIDLSLAAEKLSFGFPAPRPDIREERWLKGNTQVDVSSDHALFSAPHTRRFAYVSADRIGASSSHHLVAQDELAGPVGSRGEYTMAFLQKIGLEGESVSVHAGWERSLPALYSEASRCTARFRNEDVRQQRYVVSVAEWVLGWFFPETSYSLTSHKRLGVVESTMSNSKSAKEIRPENFGFGVSCALPFIAAGLGMAQSSLMLLENPEAHLNPRAQSDVGFFLAACAASGMQIFVETHSDHVVNGIRVAAKRGWVDPSLVRFHHFTRSYDEDLTRVESMTCDERGRLSSWPRGFFDQIETDLSELF